MTFSTTSGRVCLHEWDEPLLVDHVVSLLVDIREVRHSQVKRPLVILVIRTAALASGNASDVLPTAMPAILDGCEQLIVVAEPADARGSLMRSLFTGSSAAPLGRTTPKLFTSLDEALLHVQRLVPHDVLDLQRQNLRRSFPPSGKRE